MYTLFHGLYKYLTQKYEFWVLILGLDNAGKTVTNYLVVNSETVSVTYWLLSDLLSRVLLLFQTYLECSKTKFKKNYKGINPSKITTTVGLNIGNIDIHRVSLNFWDLGGQMELQSLWDKVWFKFILDYYTEVICLTLYLFSWRLSTTYRLEKLTVF